MKRLKTSFWTLIFILGAIFTNFSLISLSATPVFAVETDQTQTQQDQPTSDASTDTSTTDNQSPDTSTSSSSEESVNTCLTEAGSLGWFVCPTTGFLAKITDGLYDIIEEYLIIKPLGLDSKNPFYQVWAIFRDITNIVFVIFIFVVIYSQLTGIGISNYGIKKALPKIIVAAIMINLSYILCALLVDLSNIIGASLRGVFTSIETSITPTGILAASSNQEINYSSIVAALSGGAIITGLVVGATGGFGALFLALVPVLLGAIIAIVIAYITVAARQALVYLLIMVSPLAFVCMFLPNTEKWFDTWKKTLTSMLIFYPMFGVLFGACSLIGWVIIAAAESSLLVVLGMAVKVIPLFLSWKLLKMSGTLPGQVSATLSNFAKAPLGATSRFFTAHSALRRARYLGGTPKPYQNSRYLAQYLEDRRNRREIDTRKYIESSKLRGLGYASDYRDVYGNYTRRGEELNALQSRNARSQTRIAAGEAELEAGFDPNHAKNRRQSRRIDALNADAVHSWDALKWEAANAQKIRYDNAQGYLSRTNQALNAHIKSSVRGETLNATERAHLNTYNRMLDTMNGNHEAVHYIEAGAATEALVQQKIVSKQFTDYFSTLPPTQNVHDRLKDITSQRHSNDYIEPIISGMRVLNQRGDTDLVYDIVKRTVEGGQLRLGTHASQSLANFCMFETKDSDFTLRRFGKYINLETARVFNDGVPDSDRRRNDVFDFKEYVTGKYINYDEHGNAIEGTSKLSLAPLLKGTSIDGIERTSFAVLDQALHDAYGTDIDTKRSTRRIIFNNMLSALIGGGLKFPSGSEQIENEATWITGLKKGKNGAWKKTWLDPDSPLAGLTEADFLKNAKDFLAAQTPSQIFSLRTDLFNPIIELLADAHADALTGDQKTAYDALVADATSDPDNKDKQKALKDARETGAKQEFRKLLHEKGKLAQILLTRSAGGANNAKDKLRDFLGLDDDSFVNEYLEKYRPENDGKHKKRNRGGADPNDAHVDTGIYDESDRQYFQNLITDLYMSNPDSPTFADDALDIIRLNIGKSSYLASAFSTLLKSHPTSSNADLLNELYSLLSEPSNY